MDKFTTIDDFELIKQLGRGKFGQVWLAVEKNKGYVVALKIIKRNTIESKETAKQLRREIEIHSRLKHKNILRMYGYFYDSERLYIILEYANKGELFTILNENGQGFSEELTSCYIRQMIEALMYLQENEILHRDIKPENLLIGSDGLLKIADFGWAVKNVDKKRHTLCGTLEYLPPEMVRSKGHDHTCDLWSLGVLTYEFLQGKPPFEIHPRSLSAARRFIGVKHLVKPEKMSVIAFDFINSLLTESKSERMSLENSMSHPFILKYRKL
ncbi:Serine/threonine-protein kinase ark1 [Nosema bombycis CQ1]|uniref:Aurora kinase n=1 Tax=Nosema bombycis (strain CQ1 / CVCC 102059) TaxID=578461 RepID=R0KVB5_NOSB1|nr:Serine/threonine-protein kinase ark1 [Nosema bombycis CQ1]|eukprot:EOB14162.1 Serine/threonine-protein kinase ark1 [Nosema bombycis CQ1]